MREDVSAYTPTDVAYISSGGSTRRDAGLRFGALGRWLLDNHLKTIQARRGFDRQVQEHPALKGAEAVFVTGLESIPWVGDGLTLLEAIRGKTLDGMPLSAIERLGYAGLSIPPTPVTPFDLPGRPIIAVYHEIDKAILTPLLLDLLGPEAKKEDKQAQGLTAASYETPRRLLLRSTEQPTFV